jgi:hypothetical protein
MCLRRRETPATRAPQAVPPVRRFGADHGSVLPINAETDMTEHDRPHPSESATDEDLDPGAFVGNRPERQAETIPGGIGPKDERIAANSTQSGAPSRDDTPAGHREADAPDRREGGQDR